MEMISLSDLWRETSFLHSVTGEIKAEAKEGRAAMCSEECDKNQSLHTDQATTP